MLDINIKNSVFLPVENFCIRKPSGIFSEGKYWIYADVVPWKNSYWPNTYDTSIHAFSSANCYNWNYNGEVIKHREKENWDFGGVATPGAVVRDGKIHVFYSGREKLNGSGRRQIGMAIADHPAGPFIKAHQPILISEHPDSHLDDPIPIILADKKTIRLYYRQADHHKPQPSNYRIRMIESSDGGKEWTTPVDILRSDGNPVRAYETAEVVIVDGETWLFSFDHCSDGTCQTVLRISQNGVDFPSHSITLDNIFSKYFKRPQQGGGFQIVMIPDKDGQCRHAGISSEIDSSGHFNLKIFASSFKTTHPVGVYEKAKQCAQ